MARVIMATVVCERPGGCGWSWRRRTTLRRFRRALVEYWGPTFEDGQECGRRWQRADRFAAEYYDCVPHLKVRTP